MSKDGHPGLENQSRNHIWVLMQSRIDFAHSCGKFSLGKLLFRLLIVLRWTDCDLECEKPDHRSLPPGRRLNGRLELDSRDKLATSRSKVSSCIGDAVAEEAEPAGNASVAPILRSLERIRRIIQVGICPAVKDIEEIRAERERHALLHRAYLAQAQP